MDLIAKTSEARYLNLVYDPPDFYDYFRLATPVDVVERMQSGIRPELSAQNGGMENLRTMPWDHSWTQSRHILPGWFGFGAGLAEAIKQFGLPAVREMAEEWYFFKALLYDVEMVLAKTDLNIAVRYSNTVRRSAHEILPADSRGIFVGGRTDPVDQAAAGAARTPKSAPPLGAPAQSLCRSDQPVCRSICCAAGVRGDREDDALFNTLVATVNGIARGLQDSG